MSVYPNHPIFGMYNVPIHIDIFDSSEGIRLPEYIIPTLLSHSPLLYITQSPYTSSPLIFSSLFMLSAQCSCRRVRPLRSFQRRVLGRVVVS